MGGGGGRTLYDVRLQGVLSDTVRTEKHADFASTQKAGGPSLVCKQTCHVLSTHTLPAQWSRDTSCGNESMGTANDEG